MARSYIQTDTATQHGSIAACSGATAGDTLGNSQIEEGGTAGTNVRTCEPGLGLTRRTDHFETPSGGVGETDWGSAGAGNNNWVVRRNLTTARGGEWDETYVCERTAAGGFNTVVSETNQNISLSTAGVQTHTLEANDFTASAGTSQVYIVCVDTGPDHGNDANEFTNGQNIDTPIAAAAGGIIIEVMHHRKQMAVN